MAYFDFLGYLTEIWYMFLVMALKIYVLFFSNNFYLDMTQICLRSLNLIFNMAAMAANEVANVYNLDF